MGLISPTELEMERTLASSDYSLVCRSPKTAPQVVMVMRNCSNSARSMSGRVLLYLDPTAEKRQLRILSLETISESFSQQLVAKDEEIASLRRQLNMIRGKSDAHLLEQIDRYVREKENTKKLIQAFETKREEVKNKLVILSDRCQEMEAKVEDYQNSNSNILLTMFSNNLKDALEKNKQWVAYDQQREAYMKGILDRMSWLEKQLNQANQAPSEQYNEAHSHEEDIMAQMQEHYENLLFKAKQQLEVLREKVSMAYCDPDEMLLRFEEKQRQVDELKQELQEESLSKRKSAEEAKRESRLRAKAKELQDRLAKEKHRSTELLLQVNLLRVHLREDQKKMAILGQQIQVCSEDLKDEKEDCLYLQKHLQRVLKELRKTKGHEAKLSEVDASSYEASSHNRHVPYKPPRENVTSFQIPNLLDESFLECPGCQAQYPTSKHRELLAHLDYCLGC
ncbi:centrosomal protein of 55 kDa-like [Lampris incognitus]|uniref:centrosomal protein of 55 kDa-like n=1 Tax=Lampris incognitus TaxID=2546036 RepID=UPI0024B5917C|nr:centrosomal protein of 55 kDa-like [Lampris incognitus]